MNLYQKICNMTYIILANIFVLTFNALIILVECTIFLMTTLTYTRNLSHVHSSVHLRMGMCFLSLGRKHIIQNHVAFIGHKKLTYCVNSLEKSRIWTPINSGSGRYNSNPPDTCPRKHNYHGHKTINHARLLDHACLLEKN